MDYYAASETVQLFSTVLRNNTSTLCVVFQSTQCGGFLSSTREVLIRAHHLDLFSESISLFGHQTLLPLSLSPSRPAASGDLSPPATSATFSHLSSQFLHFFLMLVVREVQGGWWSCLFYNCQLWFDRGGK